MLGTGLRFWLAALAAPLLLSSCASYYELEVRGTGTNTDRHLYLIVGDVDEDAALKLEKSQDLRALTDADKNTSYLFYAQYDADKGNELIWKKVTQRASTMKATVTLSEQEDVVTVSIDKSLGDAHRLAVIALSMDKFGKWFAKGATARMIDEGTGMQLRLGATGFIDETTSSILSEVGK